MSQRNPRSNAKAITKVAEQLGFFVVHTPGGHRVAVHPSGMKVFFATTSVSPRGLKNAIAMLRRTARQLNATADLRSTSMDVEVTRPNDVSVVHTTQTASPTVTTYSAFQRAFEHFSRKLFEDRSPPCLITLQRKGHVHGYYSSNKLVSADGATKLDEIALNPQFFHTQGVREVISTLVHEMVHQLQHHSGKPMKGGYHDRQWGAAMKAIGLWPSSTGKPGGRETGIRMSHYIVEGGPFDLAFAELNATIEWGDVLRPEREGPPPKAKRVKFVCPNCDFNVLAVPSAVGKIACIPCGVEMVAT